MTPIKATRRIQFCSGHRVCNHESKCRNLHGHNYVLYITCEAKPLTSQEKLEAHYSPEPGGEPRVGLDQLGRVIDFSVIKDLVGTWIDENWDHGFIFWAEDKEMCLLYAGGQPLFKHKFFALPTNPTAENMADYLLRVVCPRVLRDTGVRASRIVLEETENCSVEVSL